MTATSVTSGSSGRAWLSRTWLILTLSLLPLPVAVLDTKLHVGAAIAAFTVGAAIAATGFVLHHVGRTTQAIDATFATSFLAVVALWRHAEGGAESGYGPLVMGPLLFVSLYGTRRHVIACVVGILLVFVVPSLMLEADAYPFAQELRRATIWTLVSLVAGLSVSTLVQRVSTARQALVQERSYLVALVESLHEGVIGLDSKGRITLANETVGEMLDADVTADEDAEKMAAQVRLFDAAGQALQTDQMPLPRTLAGEIVRDEPFSVEHRDGTRRELEMTGTQIRDHDGTVLGAVFTTRDVTAQRQAERMKDQFFALVSHELRTPLAAIVGYLELLDEEEHDRLSEDGREFVAVMQRNSQRLMRLIGDLLFAAQVDAGTLSLVRGPLDLARVVTDAADTARVRAEAEGLVLDVSITPSGEPIEWHGDRDRLGQVLDNLLTNAIKFTPAGGRVGLELTRSPEGVVLTVTDTGRGIEPEDLERLFERFARARSADEDAVQGVGLGLAISRAIVEAHDGRIEVDSEPGEGTTFRVTLPAASSGDDGTLPGGRQERA